MSPTKKRYSVMKGAFSSDNIADFLNNVLKVFADRVTACSQQHCFGHGESL